MRESWAECDVQDTWYSVCVQKHNVRKRLPGWRAGVLASHVLCWHGNSGKPQTLQGKEIRRSLLHGLSRRVGFELHQYYVLDRHSCPLAVERSRSSETPSLASTSSDSHKKQKKL